MRYIAFFAALLAAGCGSSPEVPLNTDFKLPEQPTAAPAQASADLSVTSGTEAYACSVQGADSSHPYSASRYRFCVDVEHPALTRQGLPLVRNEQGERIVIDTLSIRHGAEPKVDVHFKGLDAAGVEFPAQERSLQAHVQCARVATCHRS